MVPAPCCICFHCWQKNRAFRYLLAASGCACLLRYHTRCVACLLPMCLYCKYSVGCCADGTVYGPIDRFYGHACMSACREWIMLIDIIVALCRSRDGNNLYWTVRRFANRRR
ncbi:uncharacterized protein BO80DRAFT_248219 [Aspergillus ibericus CBS 121593]|uniref:Uncharacterized protein n=1 Tax=Aspergillus ibericus CBS 121593 TaxID=1448316 RepID=A0A395GLB3_9EURO|nr:hypothetical protein BO80DRAFT_248219 [Aspergillus ibericus CBS 121593]RAK95768.1 hypothetical protein BO80DRAFT_248219 [Aspergillus ibericus CBS 121593]